MVPPSSLVLARRIALSAFLFLAMLPAASGSKLLDGAVPQANAQDLTINGKVKRQSVSEQLAAAEVGDTVAVIIDRANRSRIEGILRSQDEHEIEIAPFGGGTRMLERDLVYAVARAGIKDKRRRKKAQGKLHPDHTNGKLFFFPTARRNQEGTSMVLNDPGLLLPYVDFTLPGGGLTLRAGSSAFPIPWQYMHGGGKLVLVPLDRFSVAVGALGGLSTNYFISDEYDDEWAGLGWVETTIDLRAQENENGQRVETTGVTLGAGYIASGSLVGDGLVLMGGFEHRYGGNFKLLLEGEYLPAGSSLPEGGLFPNVADRTEPEWIASAGVRHIGAITTLEAGLLTGTPLFDAPFPVAPILGFGLKVF